ncbi:MAG TPA: GspMb/PilO family protein [Kribbella sp.]
MQLLNRSHSGTTPTAAGEMLVRRARAILADHDQAVAEVIALGNNGSIVAGRIRVGVPLELPLDALPSALAELREAHPGISVLGRATLVRRGVSHPAHARPRRPRLGIGRRLAGHRRSEVCRRARRPVLFAGAFRMVGRSS